MLMLYSIDCFATLESLAPSLKYVTAEISNFAGVNRSSRNDHTLGTTTFQRYYQLCIT